MQPWKPAPGKFNPAGPGKFGPGTPGGRPPGPGLPGGAKPIPRFQPKPGNGFLPGVNPAFRPKPGGQIYRPGGAQQFKKPPRAYGGVKPGLPRTYGGYGGGMKPVVRPQQFRPGGAQFRSAQPRTFAPRAMPMRGRGR